MKEYKDKPTKYPIGTTRKRKLKFANAVADALRTKYADTLIAAGIYGSVGRGDDRKYSDIEIMAIVDGAGIYHRYEGLTDGIKYEIDVISIDEGYAEIDKVNVNWPIAVGVYLNVLPLFDDEDVFSRFRYRFESVTNRDFSPYIRFAFVHDIYEQVCKILNAYDANEYFQLRHLSYHLYNKMIGFLGLLNKHVYGSIAQRGLEAMKLPLNFDSFRRLGRVLLIEDRHPEPQTLRDVSADLLAEIITYLRQNNINFVSDKIDLSESIV